MQLSDAGHEMVVPLQKFLFVEVGVALGEPEMVAAVTAELVCG